MNKWKNLPTEACRIGGINSQKTQAERALEREIVRPPLEMERLRTIVSVDHMLSNVNQLDLFRGSRTNNYHLMINGTDWIYNTTATRISTQIRRKLGLRFIIV